MWPPSIEPSHRAGGRLSIGVPRRSIPVRSAPGKRLYGDRRRGVDARVIPLAWAHVIGLAPGLVDDALKADPSPTAKSPDRSALLLGGRLHPVQAPASSTARSRTA